MDCEGLPGILQPQAGSLGRRPEAGSRILADGGPEMNVPI